jgi:hypothetical protein
MKSSASSALWTLAGMTWLLATVALADGGPQHQVKQNPPIKMGTSGGSVNDHSNFFCCSGTLGSLVTRDGVLCILSNNHVLARSGSATTGEDTLQPGLVDTNCSGANSNIVGDFAGNIVPLGTGNVDVGLSTARSNVDATGAILDVGVPCSGIQAPVIGLAVMKSGRTTGLTTGTITSIHTSVTVQYQKGCGVGHHFNVSYTNQIMTGAMSAGGDSGSLLVSNDGSPNPVGLLYAGSSSSTVYNTAQDVSNALTAGGHTFSWVGNACLADGGSTFDTPSEEEIAVALRVKVENERVLFAIQGVMAVGIGAAEDNPIEAVITVYADPTDNAGLVRIPTSIEGVRVRMIVTDRIVAQ